MATAAELVASRSLPSPSCSPYAAAACQCRPAAPRRRHQLPTPPPLPAPTRGLRAAGASLRWAARPASAGARPARGPGASSSRSLVRSALRDSPSPGGGPGDNPVVWYQGVYGPWTVDSADVREVVLYRAGLVTAAAAFVAGAATAVVPPDSPVAAALTGSYDALYAVGAAGLGLSLGLIHIYVTPIKRALQLLWLAGALGSLGLAVNFAAPADQGLVRFVLDHPAGVWAVGPMFAALTGLVFKEGLCYGKLEAAALFFVIPALLLGHLSGVMDQNVELGLLAAWTALFAVFAARKFSQPIKDDIGDKSVFIFNALPQAEKEALLSKLKGTGLGPPGPD